jgi:hypothetical protein
MVDQIAGIVIGLELVPVVFPGNRKHKIAYHRKTYDKKHISQILQKKHGKDSHKEQRTVQSEDSGHVYIIKQVRDRIKYKIQSSAA